MLRPRRMPSPSGAPAASVSVVVPTLNEAAFLPSLLDALAAQTNPPLEVVVADAGSADDTLTVARARGARVVRGGSPAKGRNAGAAASRGDLLLFLDADVKPGPDFLRHVQAEFAARGLDAATAPLVPLERAWDLRAVYVLTEAYLRAVARLRPHAVGACLIARRSFHERLGGFDEELAMGEDHDYAHRAAVAGRYGVLRSVKIPTSMRRVQRQGRLRYARITFQSELRTLAGRPPRRLPEGYELGGVPPARSRGATGRARTEGADARRAGALSRWCRILARPSTEVQGDAVAVAVAAAVLGLVARVVRTPWARAAAAASGVVAVTAAGVALQAVRHQRGYGQFFSATVATASHDVRDTSGRLLARAGEDAVCELHVVRHLARLAELRRRGPSGRLAARREIVEGIAALADSFDDPRYGGVTALVARADIARALGRLGFQVVEGPKLDLANRAEKWLLARRTLGAGAPPGPGGVRPDCLVVLSRQDWQRPETRAAIDAWLGEIDSARRRAH